MYNNHYFIDLQFNEFTPTYVNIDISQSIISVFQRIQAETYKDNTKENND